MKKLSLSIMSALMLLTLIPSQMKAGDASEKTPISAPAPTESAEANAMIARLYEIKAMDLTKLNGAEKKQLRHEVKAIKSNLKALTGGVYLSVGAIIIILLLILLLL